MTSPTATIDGRVVTFEPGETILATATRAGISIPTLCHVAGLEAEAGCRVCLVETNRSVRPVGACHTPAAPDLEIQTRTPRLERLRREVLALHLEAGPIRLQGDGSGTEFERLLAAYGLGAPPRAGAPVPDALDDSHPYLRFDPSLCITCRRCLHACEEVQGQFVYGVTGRGPSTRLIAGPGERFAESDCTACGACVDRCPTGAISDVDRPSGKTATQLTRSVCGYCGVGCRVEIETAGDRVVRVRGVGEAAVNHGHLCAKGRYAHAYHHDGDRLTTPLIRTGGTLIPVSWPDAVAFAARRLTEIRATHGPQALGVLTSSRSTNEAAYLLQKLFRVRLATNNVDCCARVCHSSTAVALGRATGTSAASASYADIDRAGIIVVAGANPTEAHPVVGARLKQAVLGGARLIVIDPRRIELARYADLHLPLVPGTNVALFNAIAKVLVDDRLVDEPYLADRVEGLETLRGFLAGVSLDEAAAVTGLDVGLIREGASLIGRSKPVLFVHGLGLSELTQGTASVMTLCNLGMLTGSIGRPGAGMLPLRGQNNVQGNADVGGMPGQVTGYQSLADAKVRARLASIWGQEPAEAPGLTQPEMLDAAAAGRLRALWIQGWDVAHSDAHLPRTQEALARLELLIVQDLFPNETTSHAHLVLPAAGALEQDGTFTNGERRVQQLRAAVPPPGEARPDWLIVQDVARALGAPWSYASPAAVLEEIAAADPALFGGVRESRLTGDGVQWPCPSVDHPGTAIVHQDGFVGGKGRLTCVDHTPSPEHEVAGFPYLLVTGRVLHHYNVGTMTRRTPQRDLVTADVLTVHPQDAAREGVAHRDRAVIESRWGRATVETRVSSQVRPGMVFLSFHYPDTRTNHLTGPQSDPDSKCPEYKVTAVRLRPAAAAPH